MSKNAGSALKLCVHMFTVKTRRNKLYFQRHNYALCIVVECCSELWRCRYCRCILPHEANFTLIGLTAHIALFINTTLVARLHALRWLGVQTGGADITDYVHI